MTCPNSKHTNLPASARDPCPSSAAGRAGSSGGGLLLLLLCIALFAGPPRSSPPSPAAPPGKPIPMGKPLPPSMGGLPATVSKSSRGPWRPWSGLEVCADELWAFLPVLVAIAAFALLCLWLGGAFVPVVHGPVPGAASAPSSAPPPTPTLVQLLPPGPSPFADRFPFLSDEAIRELWSDADTSETWKSAIDRAFRYCHGAARDDELLAILRLHPRARLEPNWPVVVERLIDAQSVSVSGLDLDDRPACRFFKDDRASVRRFESEEVSPSF